MAESDFEQARFPSTEALIREIQELSDDIESVTIQVANGILVVGPDGKSTLHRNAGALLKLSDGTSRLIHREDAEALLNDGILNRMRLPVRLLPLHKDPEV